MSELIAYVDDIQIKTGVGRNNKPYTVYNVLCTTKSGESKRIGWGFNAPSFKAGEWIKTSTVTNDRGYEEYQKNAPVEVKSGPAPTATQGDASSSGTAPGNASPSQTQQNIHYQNSRTAAIELTGLLLENNALPISSAKAKAGEAKRFEQIIEAVEKLTVQLYNDLDTFRLFEKHADSGEVVVPTEDEIPEEVPEPDVPETDDAFGDDDDIPF